MNIKTKYNEGDTVYCAFRKAINGAYQRIVTEETIWKISVHIKDKEITQSYTLSSGSSVGNDNIFLTRETAEKAIKWENIKFIEDEIKDLKYCINEHTKNKKS